MLGPFRFRSIASAFYRKRWIIILLLSIVFHWLAFQWVNGNLVIIESGMPKNLSESIMQTDAKPVQISLAEAVQAKAAPLPTTNQALTRRPAKTPARASPAATQGMPPAHAMTGTKFEEPIEVADSSNSLYQEALDLPISKPSSDTVIAKEAPSSEEKLPQVVQYKTSMPPSAELKYDVLGERKGMVYHGTGTIDWESDGEQYTITGRAKALFFTVSEFRSEGTVAASGIAPVRYMERSGSKAQAHTHFDQKQSTISFSTSTISYPSDNSPQDRASLIWQLAAIGRGSPEIFIPNTELDIFVAGARNAENWRIRVIDRETIEFDGQQISTWHVKSVRQGGSKEKMIDVWFASELNWYPVKLRHTEFNGDYLELSLTSLTMTGH